MKRVSLFLTVAGVAASLAATLVEAQTPMVSSPQDFVSGDVQSDNFEVLEAHTAIAQTSDPRIRAFAEKMIEDHARMNEALDRAATKAGITAPPKGLSGDQRSLLSALQSERGPEFDRTYVKQQILAHQQALVVNRAYATQGSNPELQDAARSAVPIIHRHLELAERLRAELGGG